MGASGNLTAHQLAGQPDDGAIDQIRIRVLPDGRMTREDAARYLGHQPKTLAMWQLQGKGPRPVKVGGRVFYYLADLKTFVASLGGGK